MELFHENTLNRWQECEALYKKEEMPRGHRMPCYYAKRFFPYAWHFVFLHRVLFNYYNAVLNFRKILFKSCYALLSPREAVPTIIIRFSRAYYSAVYLYAMPIHQ